jgi:hypothetical protein
MPRGDSARALLALPPLGEHLDEYAGLDRLDRVELDEA